MRYFIGIEIFGTLMQFAYIIIGQLVKKSSSKYQPFIALALPFWRELDVKVTQKLVKMASSGDYGGSMIFLNYQCYVSYAITLCTILGRTKKF